MLFFCWEFCALERRTWLQPRPTWETLISPSLTPVRTNFSLGVINTILQHAKPVPACDTCRNSASCQKHSSPSPPQGSFVLFFFSLCSGSWFKFAGKLYLLNITFTDRPLLATGCHSLSQHPYFLTLSCSLILLFLVLVLQFALLLAI